MFANKGSSVKEKDSFMDSSVASRPTSSKDVTTLIGEGCKVEGNFFIPTFTRIDGIIKGDIHGESGIIIGKSGKVEGNVFATEVALYGEVKGKIETQKLELKKGSTLNGDIVASNLITEGGIIFNGHCTMGDNIQQNVTELTEHVKTA